MIRPCPACDASPIWQCVEHTCPDCLAYVPVGESHDTSTC